MSESFAAPSPSPEGAEMSASTPGLETPSAPTPTSEAGAKLSALQHVETIIVAVHGIGEPFWFETIESVARSFCEYADAPAAIPLGWFHTQRVGNLGYLELRDYVPPFPTLFKHVGFAEVYWAGIPRELTKEGFTVEEAKAWASKMVRRMAMRAKNDPQLRANVDFTTLEHMIKEMIEGVVILENLLKVGRFAGLVDFQLRRILDSFLGDVQVVTEFEADRARMIRLFKDVFEKIHQANPRAELYIVAHSEGTVVSFLGMLDAITRRDPTNPNDPNRWVTQVRGYMTIGSPIDKHLYLWPEIFLPYGSPQTLRKPWGTLQDDGTYKALAPISWQNYYDYGDPVAHRLDRTRRFLRDFGWNQVFEFEAKTHDHGFARYPFPGQAHLDYWDDADVFGHFIQTVVKPPAGTWHNAKLAERFTKPPATRRFVSLFSRVVPYLLAFLVLLGGFALLYHATRAFAEPELHNLDYPIQVWLNILGFTSLLAGITVVARVARLNRRWSTLLCSLVFWAIGLGFYYLFTQPEAQRWAASVLLQTDLKPSLAALAAAPLSIPASYIHHWSILDMFALSGELPGRAPLIECRLVILGISLALVFLAYVFSYRFPHWGAKTLIIPGCLIIAVVLFVAIRSDKPMSESSAATDPHLRLQEDARLLHQLEELYEARRREWSARHPLPPSGAAVTATRLAERERSFQAELGDIRARLDQRSRALIERRVRIAARGSVLPLLLSAAAFLYLWWIAIILFDMTFVWHRFIRGTHTSVEAYFDRIIDQSKVAELPPTSTRQGFDPGI